MMCCCCCSCCCMRAYDFKSNLCDIQLNLTASIYLHFWVLYIHLNDFDLDFCSVLSKSNTVMYSSLHHSFNHAILTYLNAIGWNVWVWNVWFCIMPWLHQILCFHRSFSCLIFIDGVCVRVCVCVFPFKLHTLQYDAASHAQYKNWLSFSLHDTKFYFSL